MSSQHSENSALEQSEADIFLNQLAGRQSLTFQTFDESKAKRPELNRILHGKLDRHWQTLCKLNQQGAGVFVMVNKGNGKGRKNDNVQAIRALFVDLDGSPLQPILNSPVAPHVIIKTSPERYHAYWFIHSLRLEYFNAAQKQLAGFFGGDPAVCDLARVMRIPGFNHNKGLPFAVRILHRHTQPSYLIEDLQPLLGESLIKTITKQREQRKIYLDGYVMASKQFGKLKPATRDLYIALHQAYKGSNNGRLSVSCKSLRPFNCGDQKTVYKHRDALLDMGLIVKTKAGKQRQADWYAITAKPIDYAGLTESDLKQGNSLRHLMKL